MSGSAAIRFKNLFIEKVITLLNEPLILEDMGKTRLYDEYDFPKDDRRVEELIDFIAQTDSWSGNAEFEVGYLKGLETALRIVMT